MKNSLLEKYQIVFKALTKIASIRASPENESWALGVVRETAQEALQDAIDIEDSKEPVEYQVTGEDIIAALKETGRLTSCVRCEIIFRVPGGGDYSNMDIEIDEENPVRIKTTTEYNS